MANHLADVRKYDATADQAVVAKIVKHLGIALRNPESSMVSCSDEKELARLRQKWCVKKLRVGDAQKADGAIARVRETMSSDNAKSRVTFYYLVAKHLGKLDTI